MYELLLAVHLLAAVTWVGGSIALTLISARVAPADRRVVGPHFSWYGAKVIPAAAGILILAGIGLVLELDYVGFGDLWIILALVGWLASGIIGVGILGPTGEKMAAVSSPEEAGPLYDRLMRFQWIDAMIVVLIVIDMAVKPGA